MRRVACNWLICSVLAASVSVLSGCGDLGQFDRYRRDFHIEKPFQPNGRIEVENFNGRVDIASWSRDSLEVSGTKSGPSQAQLEQLNIDVRVDGGVAFIHVDRPPGSWNGSYEVKLSIRVPKQTTISRVKTTNAGVGVEDIDGGGVVNSTNGRVALRPRQWELRGGNYQRRHRNRPDPKGLFASRPLTAQCAAPSAPAV